MGQNISEFHKNNCKHYFTLNFYCLVMFLTHEFKIKVFGKISSHKNQSFTKIFATQYSQLQHKMLTIPFFDWQLATVLMDSLTPVFESPQLYKFDFHEMLASNASGFPLPSFSTASTQTAGYMEEEQEPKMISVLVRTAMKPDLDCMVI